MNRTARWFAAPMLVLILVLGSCTSGVRPHLRPPPGGVSRERAVAVAHAQEVGTVVSTVVRVVRPHVGARARWMWVVTLHGSYYADMCFGPSPTCGANHSAAVYVDYRTGKFVQEFIPAWEH